MLQSFHKNQHPSPCISVASTTIELLNYLKEIIGCGVIVFTGTIVIKGIVL